MKLGPVLCAGALLALGACRVAAEESVIPPTTEVGGRELVLNGQATRTVWGFRVYDVGLFLERPATDGEAVMRSDPGPKRVQMNMLRAVDKQKFVDTVRQNIEQNLTPAEQETFARELSEYIGHLEEDGDIQPGRVITIDYVPGQGTVLGLDGRPVGTIAGRDFYHIMLRLWIGRPLQASIKEGLLGGAASGD